MNFLSVNLGINIHMKKKNLEANASVSSNFMAFCVYLEKFSGELRIITFHLKEFMSSIKINCRTKQKIHTCHRKWLFYSYETKWSRPCTSKLHFVSVFKIFSKNLQMSTKPSSQMPKITLKKKRVCLFVCVSVCVSVCQQFFVERLQAKRFDLQSCKWYHFVGNFKEMCPLLKKFFDKCPLPPQKGGATFFVKSKSRKIMILQKFS